MSGLAEGRSKRQKIDKNGRLSAFEKLKELKKQGSKRKYEVNDLQNVYDTVNEDEYTERVLQRQEEDWIEDDDGCGYVEDGREIFDDEEIKESPSVSHSKENGPHSKKRKGVSAFANGSGIQNQKGSIQKLLSSMPQKKKEDVKLSEDDILSEIMSEIKPNTSSPVQNKTDAKPFSVRPENSKREAQNYFKNLNNTVKETKLKKSTPLKTVQAEKLPIKEDLIIIDAPSPKKRKHDIQPIKIEKDIEPTQTIEEFNSQDLHFDDINFDDDFAEDKVIKKETSFEEKPAPVLPEIKIKKEPIVVENKTSVWSNPAQIKNQELSADSLNLPLVTNKKGQKVLQFYWWDAWEDRFVKPGTVFLFGKVYIDSSNPSKGCVSCCVAVRNIDRKMYLLPRDYKLDSITLEEDNDHPVSIKDVYDEFNSKVTSTLGIKEFKSRKVTKNYAFEHIDVPVQSEYLEVRYSANHPTPPTDTTYLTFSRIFGANTSSLETLLLERKIMGPCWLEIEAPENVSCKISWCKIEANCLKPENITVMRDEIKPPPPLVMATINTRTLVDPKTRHNGIIMISCLITNAYEIHKTAPNPPFQQHFCLLTKSSSEIWPADFKQAITQFKDTKLTKFESEREMLSYFLVQFWKSDPDIIVGHDLYGYQQDLLISNIIDKDIPNWSRLGRLKRTVVPPRKFLARDAFLGRLVCDVKVSSMELIRSRSYDLATLCSNVLKLPENTVSDVTSDEIYKYYENSKNLLELVLITMQDTSYILKLMYELNVLPLALQITQIAGNVMSRTLMGGRSERNEFLLLHAFTEKDYIVPDKSTNRKAAVDDKRPDDEHDETGNVSKKQIQSRKKPAYSGGLVLEPKKGFYDSLILLMDFNSLYPSIIQEYNICFTTIKRSAMKSPDDITDMVLPDANSDPGILPRQIRKLVESRKEVKKLMKVPDLFPEQYMQYNIRQTALKLTANSMYGCLGFTHSRFYAKPLAALVTMKGREILMNTKDLAGKLNYDVVYGDTDSIMINTNCLDYEQVFKIGQEIKKEINKKYRQVELDIDGVFRYLLLLKKKKYAAVSMSKNKNGELVYTQELKGLDIVRRDWSQLAAESGKFILNQILSEQSPDERVENIQLHLNKLREDLIAGKLPLSVLTITKQLTKNPNEYADKNGQPHVQVALRLNNNNKRKYKKGDIVPYIICEDGTNSSAVQRAYHIDELRGDTKLKIDHSYYLSQQLHPVISRICDPIEGLDSSRIADFLGLDPSLYKQTKREQNDNVEIYQAENEKEKYRQCEDFIFTCVDCKTVNKIRDIFAKDNVTFLESCQNDKCNRKPIEYLPTIMNQLTLHIRNCTSKYYNNWLICEDPACTNRIVKLPHYFTGGYPLCTACEKGVMFREYTEKDLYYQISFYYFLFNLEKHNTQKAKLSAQIQSAFHCMKEYIEDVLAHSAYSVINLTDLFSFFDKKEGVNVKSEPIDVHIPNIELDEYNLDMPLDY